MAGFRVDLQLQTSGLDALKAVTDIKLFDKAIAGGIKYASKAGIVQAAKSVGQRYNLKAARIKEDIRISSINKDQATLLFRRRPPTLNQFGITLGKRGGKQPGLGRGMGWGKPSPAGRPISARIFKGGPRQAYGNAFMVTGPNGQAIPVRSVNGKLKAIYGPSVGSDIFGRSRHAAVIQAEVATRINEQFITGMQRVLDSASRGYTK